MKYKVFLLIVILCMLFSMNVFADTKSGYDKVPILFVHGFSGSASNFAAIEAYLKANGIDAEMKALNLPSKLGSNALNGAAIAKAVEDTGALKVNIIAHSMGGANSLYYITRLDGINKVDKLITLGGVNNTITKDAPSGVEVTTISSNADLVVNKRLSELNGANNIVINGVGHIGLLRSLQVNELIKEALLK